MYSPRCPELKICVNSQFRQDDLCRLIADLLADVEDRVDMEDMLVDHDAKLWREVEEPERKGVGGLRL